MNVKKAQKLYDKYYAVDVLIEDNWRRCIRTAPSKCSEAVAFRRGHGKLGIVNGQYIDSRYDNCLPLSKWEKARLEQDFTFKPKNVKVGDTFYVETANSHVEKNQIVTLVKDDKSSSPIFKTKNGNYYISFCMLYPLTKVKRKKQKKPKYISVSEFIKRKNKILRDTLGLDFDVVPEDQIQEVEQKPLSIEYASFSCPYCVAFRDEINGYVDCSKCPMKKAENGCLDYNSTWKKYTYKYIDKIYTSKDSPAYEPMKKLIDEYNAGLKHKPKYNFTVDKTLEKHLKRLNVWKKFIKNAKQHKDSQRHIKEVASAFYWGGTKEGHSFWNMIFRETQNMEKENEQTSN